MKKLIALSLLLSSLVAKADMELDFQLTAGDETIKRHCVLDDEKPTYKFEEDGLLFEITAVPQGKNEVITTIKMSIQGIDGQTYVVAAPVIKSVWNKEAVLTLSDEVAEITFQVTAHKIPEGSAKK